MRIALVCHRLDSAELKRVVETTVQMLVQAGDRVALICGHAGHLSQPIADRLGPVPELGVFDPLQSGCVDPIVDSVYAQARMLLDGPPDIWHILDPNFGWNPQYSQCVLRLAQRGEALLLHNLRFPEDSYKVQYSCARFLADQLGLSLSEYLYPTGTPASRIHYAVSNDLGFEVLAGSGVSSERLHLVLEPLFVDVPSDASLTLGQKSRSEICQNGEEMLLVYPGAISRRHQTSELILWAWIAAQTGTPFHIASLQSPTHPDEMDDYQNWIDWAAELDVPLTLDIQSMDPSLGQGLSAVCDGYCFTHVRPPSPIPYIEPIARGKILTGRAALSVLPSLHSTGLPFDYFLYPRIAVPESWLSSRHIDYVSDFVRAFERECGSYAIPCPTEAAHQAACSHIIDGKIDFGRLSDAQKNVVISTLRSDSDLLDELVPKELPLNSPDQSDPRSIAGLTEKFGPAAYVHNLRRVYESVIHSPPGENCPVSAELVLSAYLNPDQFHFLCT